jgi:EAL domain-containing protein (putative c-di-GMP-specific phosphodiesterase class I)
MYQAKSSGSGVLLYDSTRDGFSRQRLRTAEELRRGIETGQLQVWYQPQVDAATGLPCAVEALVRWVHPKDGLRQPGSFLEIARHSGLMPALTEAVVERVAADARRWQQQGLGLHVAVNFAPAELLDAVVLEGLLRQVVEAGLPRDSVILEVTEDSFLAEPDRARAAIERLRCQGIQVSIDDYGMGYSSLSYLRDLPVQELKIDRSFVADLLLDPRSRLIVSTTTQLAHGLGLRTVAEGVEDEALAAELLALGVDVLQGYYFARPMPGAEVAGWVLAQSPASRVS